MKLGTFKGGSHPYDGKELSMNLPVKTVLPGKELVYPMSQHIGAPARPIVAMGDRVLMGQRIAEAAGFISANICSSVSGTVKAIESRLTVSGAMSQSVVIQNDGEYAAVENFGKERDYRQMSKEEIREAVKAAGIVGMGGAGFPTHVKLTPKDDRKIDYVLVNGAECEPYLTSDYRMMLEETEKLIEGLKIILSLFPKAKGIICIEDNKPEAIRKIGEAIEGEERISLQPLKTKYPQGAERMLIYAATGRKIWSAMLPADAGCIVDNVDTVISIYNAVALQVPLIRRIVTVTGDCVKTPQNFQVKTGTYYRELVEEAGGLIKEPKKVISGGPMMGMALYTLDVPVTKTSSALLFMSEDEVAANEPTPCIRCGRCVQACPENLIPQILIGYAQRQDYEGFEKANGMECCECGSCTFVCPAKRRLTQAFKQARRQVLDNRRKNA